MLEFLSLLFLSVLLIAITIFVFIKVFYVKPSKFLQDEASRAFKDNFETSKNWSSQGRVFTQGMSITQNSNGEVQITGQAKLADTGLLY